MLKKSSKGIVFILWLLYVVCFSVVLIAKFKPAEPAERCAEIGYLVRGTSVWAEPPRFMTAQGWTAYVVATLPPRTTVYSCRRTTVGYLGNRRIIRQIAWRDHNSWKYGWIPDGVFKPGRRSALEVRPVVFMAQASAPPPPGTDGPKSHSLGLSSLYVQLFTLVAVGIVARALWDWMAEPHALRSHIRSGIGAVVLTPIVFGGFLQTADFTIQGEKGYLMLLLLAFQQGFFWQGLIRDVGQRRNNGA